MQRMNKKGFILTETLVVTVVLLVSFVFVFTQFITIFASYKQFENYNDIDGLYSATNMEKFVTEDNLSYLIDELNLNKGNGMPYYDFTNCPLELLSFSTYCISLINQLEIKRIIITDYNLSELILFDNYDNDFSYQFKKYMEYLERRESIGIIGEYRLILEMENGTFANKIINAEVDLPTKNQYRYKPNYITFNNGRQQIDLPPLPAQTNPPLSFSAWIKWDGSNLSGIWGHWGTTNNNVHFELYSDERKLRLRFGEINRVGLTPPIINKWTYFTFTYDGSVARTYYNGVEIDSFVGSAGTIFGANEHSLADSHWGLRPFYGSMKEVSIYNRALSQFEIVNNMSGDNIIYNGLLYYYKMSEGTGTTLNDYSGNNYSIDNALNDVVWQVDDNYSNWIDGSPVINMHPVVDTRTLYFYENNWIEKDNINNGLIFHYKFNDFQESTRNLITETTFESGWTSYDGAIVTKTQDVAVAEWDTRGATKIQTTGGTSYLKTYSTIISDSDAIGKSYTLQVKIKNIGTTSAKIYSNRGELSEIVEPGQTKHVILTIPDDSPSGHIQMQLRTLNVTDNLNVIVYQPQLEEKPYATPFVNEIREGLIKDHSLNNNNSKLEVETSPKWIKKDGNHKGIYSFNDHSINIGRNKLNPYFEDASATTVSAWIKLLSPLSNTGYIFYEPINSSLLSNLLSVGNTHNVLFGGRSSASDSYSNITSNKVLDLNKWYLVTGILDFANSKILIYINDKLDNVSSTSFNMPVYTPGTPSIDSLIGNHSTTAGRNFNGLIDDIRVYNRALTIDEIKYIYDNER